MKEKVKVIRVTKKEFELEDGRIYQHPIELDYTPTIKEFQEIYDKWYSIMKEMIHEG